MNHSFESQFDDDLDGWIVAAMRSGVADFWQLVAMLPGVYPTVARDAVERLVNDSRIPANVFVEAQGTGSLSDLELEVPGLPPPHPLSSDWRFTRRTASSLLERVMSSTKPTGRVALVGVPSVFFLASLERSPRQFVLLDDNPVLADRVPMHSGGMEFHHCDVEKESVDIPPSQIVLADPPWYEDDVLEFLRTSVRVCTEGATVFLSFGANGTRPGISGERQHIINEANKMGLRFVGTESLSLSYATPFFEHNALRAAKFRHIPPSWRRGDLLVFHRDGNVPPTEGSSTATKCLWTEARIREIGLRVRTDEHPRFADPRLIQLVPGDILPAVSRRDALSKAADVWTTGNRIYRCAGKNILSTVLRALAECRDPIDDIQQALRCRLNRHESGLVATAIGQVNSIVQTERQELWSFSNGRR